MNRLVVAIAVLIATLIPAASFAQQSFPPGPYVIDLRGVMSGVPRATGFFPVVASTTLLPKRGFGLGVGAHLYPLQLGVARIGLGVDAARMRGTATTPAVVGTTAATSTSALTRSLNFPASPDFSTHQ